jgi:hemoglobin
VTEQVCEATGGPQRYTGRSLYDSHVHPDITEQEWQAFLEDFEQTLDEFDVLEAEQAELFAIVESTKKDIVLLKKQGGA